MIAWPEDATLVATLLGSGDLEGAVQTYFRALGDGRKVRWEQQQLSVRQVRWPRDGVRRPMEVS